MRLFDYWRALEWYSLFPGTARRLDNAVSEVFFSIFKKEELYRRRYTSEADL